MSFNDTGEIVIHHDGIPKVAGKGPTVVWWIFLILGLGGLRHFYLALDDNGAFGHDLTIDMYMAPDWLSGENRVCQGVQLYGTGQPQIALLDCPKGGKDFSEHNISVTFYGKTSRPELSVSEQFDGGRFQWRCTRHGDSFRCYSIS